MYNLKSLQEWQKVSQTLEVLPSSSTAPSHYFHPKHLNITKQKQHKENEREHISRVEPGKRKWRIRRGNPLENRFW